MGRNVGVYKTEYNTWLSSRLQNQPRSFLSFNFFPLPCVMTVTKDEESDLIKPNNDQLMASFKRSCSRTLQVRLRVLTNLRQNRKLNEKIKRLKFQEPHKSKRKAN